jgi:hypothetical protein
MRCDFICLELRVLILLVLCLLFINQLCILYFPSFAWLILFLSGLWWYSQGNSWHRCQEGLWFDHSLYLCDAFTLFLYNNLLFLLQPEDWDDEEDGEWTAPTIPNPDYKGPWKQKVWLFCWTCTIFDVHSDALHQVIPFARKSRTPTTRVNGRHLWSTTQVYILGIDSGFVLLSMKLKLSSLCCADFKDDPYIYAFDSLKYIGIELWQVSIERSKFLCPCLEWWSLLCISSFSSTG